MDILKGRLCYKQPRQINTILDIKQSHSPTAETPSEKNQDRFSFSDFKPLFNLFLRRTNVPLRAS